MTLRNIIMLAAFTGACSFGQHVLAADALQQKSTVLGAEVGKIMMTQGMNFIDFDDAAFLQGLKATLKKNEIDVDGQTYNKILTEMTKEITEKKRSQHDKEKAENEQFGKAFLEKNKKVAGVKTTTTGLQYRIEDPGTGKSPKPTNTVVVHYRGTLLDGTEFDSSYKRNQPARFRLDRVISGWTEGLQLMKQGARYTFYIPSELAYGERGAGHQIGPNQALIFEVKLVEIVD